MAGKKPSAKKQASPEVKIGILVAVALIALFGFDYVTSPDQTSEKVSAVTGRVVSGVQEAVNEPKPEASPAQALPEVTEVRIISPEKGSVQSGEFAVKVEVPRDASICYYQVRDAGSVTWDRRTRLCGEDVVVKEGFCRTKGKDTCYVLYTADSSDKPLGKDEAYYSIE